MNDLCDLFPETIEPMRHVLHEEKAVLNGTTLRLLRCRNETQPKDITELSKVGRTKNELVASYYDDKKAKFHDIIRMTVADTLPEAMPVFLGMASKEIQRLSAKFKGCDKVERNDCQTVRSFEEFAEALQRR